MRRGRHGFDGSGDDDDDDDNDDAIVDLTKDEPKRNKRPRPETIDVDTLETTITRPNGGRTTLIDLSSSPVVVAPPPPPPRIARPAPPPAPMPPCRYGDRCNRKATCRFAHPAAHQQQRSAVNQHLPGGNINHLEMIAMFGSRDRYKAYLQGERDREALEARLMQEAASQSVKDAKEAREKRRVRKDQDVEYLQSLQQDKQRLAEQERAQREVEDAAERERRVHAQAEADKREAADLLLARAQSLQALFGVAEPSEGCTVTLHLPDGTRKSRRFGFAEAVSRIVDYVEYLRTNEGVTAPDAFKLVQLPKTVLDPAHDVRCATGGASRALVYVIATDEDDS